MLTNERERYMVSAQIPQELAEQLQREAEQSDRSVSAVVRIALRDHLQRRLVRLDREENR